MEESIIESKIAERICISKEYTNEQYESEKIKLILNYSRQCRESG